MRIHAARCPDVSQERTVNSIYYAVDDPVSAEIARPRNTCRGRPPPSSRRIIDGAGTARARLVPPEIRRASRRRVGNPGQLRGTSARRRAFPAVGRPSVTVEGRPDWIFVKVHTTVRRTQRRRAARATHAAVSHLDVESAPATRHAVFTTSRAREMANIVHAAEEGASGDPHPYRDYWLSPPSRVELCAPVRRGD